MTKKTRLELTWIGKDTRPNLEPRILLEDKALSYHAKYKVTKNDIYDNLLIQGDNLLALKALESDYSGKIKCVFIDPPYNTGSAFAHYEDGLEHSIWLSMMRDRIEILRKLMSEDGSLWISIDDNESHYLKVLCDEIFGRSCFVTSIAWRSSDAANNDSKKFSSDHNAILVYSKRNDWKSNNLPRTEDSNAHYKNPDNDPRGPWFSGNVSSPNPRPNLTYTVESPNGNIIKPPSNGWRWKKEKMLEMITTGEVMFSPDGLRIIKKTYLADQKGLAPSNMWDDIEDSGHNRQAKYELIKLFPEVSTSDLFKTPKPEKLIKKILTVATVEGDLVLDSFLGSGTTAAVAHKMNRKWIGIELGDHCKSYCVPRLQKVINGEDAGGISKLVNWKGGGGFRYYNLAPSLLTQDSWGNWVINNEYNANMLAQALCKLEGFTYSPNTETYWQHGYSTENDFVYVTTATLTREQLSELSDEVGPERTLLVLCTAFKGASDYSNLTVKKIPKQVLNKCEWGHDDYSLQVENLPQMPKPAGQQDLFE